MRLMKWGRRASLLCTVVLLAGCAGFNRSCSSFNADAFGADWIVVKKDMTGRTFECWKLTNTSVANEESSDGIHWKSPGGHLVHVSGWYDRVQVANGDFANAGAELGVDSNRCGSGVYPAPGNAPTIPEAPAGETNLYRPPVQ